MKRVNDVKERVTCESGHGDMDTSEGIEYKPMCPVDISTITSSNALFSRRFQVHDLVSRHKKNLLVRAYMDYYGGYSEHARNVVYGLDATGKYNIRVLNIKTPVDVDPVTWQKNTWYTHNDIDVKNATFMVMAGPGWLQNKFLPENKTKIGWTMIESMNYSPECASWLKNVDYLLCPTDVDVRRAEQAGVKGIKMRLGYDDSMYNDSVEPVDIVGIEGRYVYGVLGSWNHRKGVADIIRAYCSIYTKDDNVTLLMVSKYGNRRWGVDKDDKERWTIKREFDEIIEDFTKANSVKKEDLPHVAIIDIPVHENVLPHIMARFDCLVGFSSGESTWLPGIQALGMRIPVIQLANDCCGYMEYLNDENSYLCRDIKYMKCAEEFWRTTSEYYKDQVFGFGNYDELADKMRLARTDADMAIKVDNGNAESKNWTWNKSIYELNKFLQRLD